MKVTKQETKTKTQSQGEFINSLGKTVKWLKIGNENLYIYEDGDLTRFSDKSDNMSGATSVDAWKKANGWAE
jgi:hypothetical protein